MIIRRRRTRNFTVVPNELWQDERLSLEARGMQAYLLSLPDDWEVRIAHLMKWAKVGRDKARRIISELVEAGWIVREQSRDPKTNAFTGVSYIVRDESSDESVSEPEPENPAPENPAVLLKKQTTKTSPIGDAPAESAQPPISKSVWVECLPILIALGVPESRARSVIGKWLKGYSPARILLAVDVADANGTRDPVAYIEAALADRDDRAKKLESGKWHIPPQTREYDAWN